MTYFIPLDDPQAPPLDAHALQARIPGVGHPAGLPDAALARHGFAPIVIAPAPAFDPATQRLGEAVNERVDGTWVRRVLVVDKTPDERAAEARAQALAAAQAYRARRAVAYPPLTDQLDALWKHAKAQGLSGDATQAADTPQGALAAIEAVKARYPKP